MDLHGSAHCKAPPEDRSQIFATTGRILVNTRDSAGGHGEAKDEKGQQGRKGPARTPVRTKKDGRVALRTPKYLRVLGDLGREVAVVADDEDAVASIHQFSA